MRNKIAVIFMTMLILISSFVAFQGAARATISGGYGYSVVNGTEAEITSYAGVGGSVVIPSTIDGYSVTSIGDYAFYSSTVLTSATVPYGVTHIGKAAFDDCISLTSVTLPQGLVSVDDYAFSESGLRSVTIPDSTVNIGDSVFSDCHYLVSVTLSKGLTSIGNGDFANCFNLTSAPIPVNVHNIGDGAFYGCRSLTSFDVPNRVTSIGNSAFQGCSALARIGLGSGLRSIDYAAFYDCTSLASIEIPDSVTDLGYGAFYGCSALASLKVGNGVTSISALTFCDCTSLASADIPGGVTAIGYSAFFGCASMRSVTVGSGVKDIGKSAFGNCSTLSSITFMSNQPSMASDWLGGYGSGLIIHFCAGASGFSAPLWQGIPSEMGARLAAPQNLTAVPGRGIVSLSWSVLVGNGSERIDHYAVFEDGAEVAQASSGTALDIPVPANGRAHVFQIAAHDPNGLGMNSSSVTASSINDSNTMLINITSPADGSFLASADVDIEWTIGAAHASIAYLNISLDGAAPVPLPVNSTSHTFPGLGEGNHSVSLIGVDGLGMTSFRNASFTVDTTPPAALLTSPNGDQVSTRANIAVTFTEEMDRTATSISLSGIAGLTIWNGSTATFLPGTTLMGNTTYTVNLVGKDRSGNDLGNTNWSFTTADVGTVSGKIADSDGRPVANATVSLSPDTGSMLSTSGASYPRSFLTDKDGNYLFYDVPVGNYTLKVTKDGYAAATSSLKMTSDDVAAGGLTIPVVLAVEGQSFDAGGILLIAAVASLAALLLIAAVVVIRKRKKL
jgi:hypothetical protein